MKHEHKYCHVDKSPKFVKKTKWVTKTVKGKTTVLEPRVRKAIVTEMVKKTLHVPDVVYGPKEVITKRKVMKNISRKVSKPVTKTRTVSKAVTTYRDEAYQTFEQSATPETRRVKKIRMVPKEIDAQELTWDEETQVINKSRWVTKPQMQSRLVESVAGCSCYKQNCECLGQPGCDCCWPACSCAPKDEKSYESVSVLTSQQVEEPYQETVVVRKPRVITRKKTIQVPEEYWADETVQVPSVSEVTKTRRVPIVTYTPQTETYVDYEVTEVPDTVEVEQEVKSFVNVPSSVMTAVEVEEPKEVQKEIIEQVAVVKPVDLQIKVPITIVERLPEPPCHWHTHVHSHGVVAGQTHSHTEDHDHN